MNVNLINKINNFSNVQTIGKAQVIAQAWRMSALLFELEMKGVVKAMVGGVYHLLT